MRISCHTSLGVISSLPANMGTLQHLGAGAFRSTYAIDAHSVIKVALDTGYRAYNLCEAYIWDEVRNTALARYFCEVRACDPKGAWIVMERADRMFRHGNQLHRSIPPRWIKTVGQDTVDKYGLGDLHASNFGLFGQDVRCTDYSGSYWHENGKSAFSS